MPRYVKGDIWDAYQDADLFCFTTNAVINGRKELVMSAGMALQVAMRYKGIARAIGSTLIQRYSPVNSICPDYHLLVSERWPDAKLACFQSKRAWWSSSDLRLVEASAEALADWATQRPEARIVLNFPAVGRGGFPQANVMPVLECLPDNVTIWRRSDGADDGGGKRER